MLEAADELVAARSQQARMVALEQKITHESEIARRVPEVVEAVSQRHQPIEQLARELEGQWVAQGPLVSLWQRAVELSQLADGAGADPADYQAEIDRARHQVEVARLQTRDVLD